MTTKLPAVVNDNSDLSERDLKAIEEFQNEGMPGFMTLEDAKVAKMMDLYLSGKSYREISMITRIEKRLIMYLSKRFDWYTLRIDYLSELESTLRNRVIESKIKSQDFLLQLTSVWERKIGDKILKYLQTENVDYANEIDLKEVTQYLKTIEVIHKLSEGKIVGKDNKPSLGLNIGDGVTIERIGDTMEITPRSRVLGDVLKNLADSRRQEEIEKRSDINKEKIEVSKGENE